MNFCWIIFLLNLHKRREVEKQEVPLERSDYQAPVPVYSPPFRPMVRAQTKEDKPQPRDHDNSFRPHGKSERSLSFDLSPPSSLDSLYTYGGAPASLSPPASLDTIYGPPPVESLPGDIDTLTAPAACQHDCQLLLSVIPNPLYRYQVSSRSPTPGLPSLQLCQVRKILLLNYLLSQQAFNTVLL